MRETDWCYFPTVQAVPIPVPALIKVHSPSNHEAVAEMPEFARLVERCRELSQDIVDRMTVHDIGYARDLRLSSSPDKGGLVSVRGAGLRLRKATNSVLRLTEAIYVMSYGFWSAVWPLSLK